MKGYCFLVFVSDKKVKISSYKLLKVFSSLEENLLLLRDRRKTGKVIRKK